VPHAEKARRLGIFDTVIASDEQTNLKGIETLAAIRDHYPEDFVYAGDCKADLPIWAQARGAVLAGTSSNVSSQVRNLTSVEREFVRDATVRAEWMHALRMHQWAKNLLLFVPLLTGFSFFDIEKVFSVLPTFTAFSFAASATYLVIDL